MYTNTYNNNQQQQPAYGNNNSKPKSEPISTCYVVRSSNKLKPAFHPDLGTLLAEPATTLDSYADGVGCYVSFVRFKVPYTWNEAKEVIGGTGQVYAVRFPIAVRDVERMNEAAWRASMLLANGTISEDLTFVKPIRQVTRFPVQMSPGKVAGYEEEAVEEEEEATSVVDPSRRGESKRVRNEMRRVHRN